MKSLYLVLNLGSFLIPFLFSFHPKLKFYRYWKALLSATIITMFIFIPWDVLFTVNGFWGFNQNYFLGIKILALPLEEWLFFICIPYACIFTHYALINLMPTIELTEKITTKITYILVTALLAMAIIFHNKWYTFIDFLYASILLWMVKRYCPEILKRYYLTFLVMLIPFVIINGILTGSLIENEVVWYNNNENLNFRIFTIPIEDTIYAFSLILTNLALTHVFYKKLN
jgi:lycopene cyclase domain-containing protein